MNLDRVLVCTVATHDVEGLTKLKESCEKLRIRLVIYGWGQQYRGSTWRLKTLYASLRHHQREFDYLLMVDGFDSIFVAGLKEIMRQYLALKTPFLISAETNCWPPFGPRPDDYPPAPTRYRFVNGGGYLARVDYWLRLMADLDVASLQDFQSDQQFWAGVYLSGRSEMRLDHECRIFQCLWEAHNDLTIREKIYNHATRSYPGIIHGNGRVDMSQVNAFVFGDKA